MSSTECESSHSSSGLNESWVELSMSTVNSTKSSGLSTPSLERLLVEAQKESGSSSRQSSEADSSRSLNSPPMSPRSVSADELLNPDEETAVRIDRSAGFDWSSRPEIKPPSDYNCKREPPVRRHPLSVRNTRVMSQDGWFNTENFPLVVTHAASFVVGASLVCWYLTKE